MPKHNIGSGRPALAIALLTLRDAVRSRFLPCLTALLVMVILALAHLVTGDGTAAGRLHLVLTYTLGVAGGLLGIATLVFACGMVSRDVKGKQIQLITVKPVHPAHIWLGRWLGLFALNALMLALVGITVYALVRVNTRADTMSRKEYDHLSSRMLVGRRPITPRAENVEQEAEQYWRKLLDNNRIPKHLTAAEALGIVRKRLRAQRAAVAPGRTGTWLFDVPARKTSRGAVALRFRFTSPARARQPLHGTWTLYPAGHAEPAEPHPLTPPLWQTTISNRLDGTHHMLIDPDGLPWHEGTLALAFSNASRAESTTALFDPFTGVELLVTESGFAANLARALLVILWQLAFLAALGITAGSLFSLPVAAFLSGAAVVIALATHSFSLSSSTGHEAGHHHGPPPEPSAVLTASKHTLEGLGHIVEPAVNVRPVSRLADGILVSWQDTGTTFLRLVLLYSGCLALVAVGLLSRRELALPGHEGHT